MKDIFKEYKKHTFHQHLGLLTLSLVLGVGINMLFFSDVSPNMLLGNTLGITNDTQTELSDITLFADTNTLSFLNNKSIQAVKEISFSLAYNPDTFVFSDDIIRTQNSQVSQFQNEAGFISYIISYDTPVDLDAQSEILRVGIKKIKDTPSFLNTININFKDEEGEIYLLSSSGIIF